MMLLLDQDSDALITALIARIVRGQVVRFWAIRRERDSG